MKNTTTVRVAIGYGQSLEVEASMETLNALKSAKVVDTRWLGDERYEYQVQDQKVRVELADPVKLSQTQVEALAKKYREQKAQEEPSSDERLS